jgi:predicted SnoaL-like aldol condensation-catalyzing enzyme
MTPREIALSAVQAIFADFDQAKARSLLAPDYIQHNVGVPTGAEPIIGFIPALQESGISCTIHRVISEGDLVVLHGTYENAQAFGGDILVAFDVFRVADGRVAEHWDNLQPLVTETASGHGMTDGATDIQDMDKTVSNKALIEGFVREVLQGHAPERVTDYISTTNYIQHNPLVADGLDGLGAAMQAFAEAGQAMTYARTPVIVAEGNFVFTASEGKLGEVPTAFFDLFRIEDGKIVEHWDTLSTIPDDMPHSNGKF